MKKTFVLLSFVLASFGASNSAHAFGLSAVGSYNLPSVSYTPSQATVPSMTGTIGFGGLLSFGAFPGFDFEIGALYTPYKYTLLNVTSSWNTLMIPVLLRFKLLPIISVAGGLFYAAPMGDGTVEGTTTTFDVKSNLGATLSAAARFPLAPTLGILIDARYNIGLKDVSTTAGIETKLNSLQVLAGLNFSL